MRMCQLLAVGVVWGSCLMAQGAGEPVVTPVAVVQTEPVPSTGDAADDPAIWVHPTDPAKTLILGTNKKGGLHVYDMSGKMLQVVSEEAHPNNVDVLYDFPLGGGKVDLAVAGVRTGGAAGPGIKVWAIDAGALKVADVTAGGVLAVFGKTEPYGTCVYHSGKTGKYFVFVNNKDGAVEQMELMDDGKGKVTGKVVRTLKCNSITEGCVADDELGWFYIAEERVGIWKFAAEPEGASEGTLITKVGEHGLTADVEGLTLYCAAGGKGYLIASSQGDSTYKVYDRAGANAFCLTIDPAEGATGGIEDVSETDGIAVSNRPAGANFPKGVFVVQDGDNSPGNQNFKLYRWEEIATTRLIVDTAWSPRR